MLLPVIMAGGVGSRLWPLSRDSYPKQYLSLFGKYTMLQQTLQRLDGLDCDNPLVVCSEKHRFIAAEQLREIGLEHPKLLLEPIGKNTAPAIALAAFKAIENNLDPILLVLPADHLIGNNESFQKLIKDSTKLAQAGKLVTFGVVPTHAETGYGYINKGEILSDNGYSILGFVEKPDEKNAKKYISSGNYFWNSGMFMFKASCYLDELRKFRPDIYDCCKLSINHQKLDYDFIRIDESVFKECPSISIDYAVMEKTKNAVVVPLISKWSDVGGYPSLWENSVKDSKGNVITGDVIVTDSTNSYISSDSGLVATIGINNLVIVKTKDAILVASRESCAGIKNIVSTLAENERKELLSHPDVLKLWGKSCLIEEHPKFQVKRVTLKLNAELQKQKHDKRAEHWVVVSGMAQVVIDGKTRIVSENQSVYIPAKATHSLKNVGDCELEIIEVRTGNYLGEDDVVRFSNDGE